MATSFLVVNLLLRMTLSLVMMVAAVGKYRDPGGGREILEASGVPPSLVAPALRALPLLEGFLGFAVLFDALCRESSLALAALFAFFCAVIVRVLVRKKTPRCHCLGVVHSVPVSKRTFARSLALSGLALVCLVLPTFRLTPGPLSSALVATAYIGLAVALNQFLKLRQASSQLAPHMLEIGRPFPRVRGVDGTLLVNLLPSAKPTIILLTSPECDSCFELKHSVFQWMKSVSGSVSIFELSARTGKRRAVEVRLPARVELELPEFARFSLETPSAILIDDSQRVLERPVSGRQEIEVLLRVALRTGRDAGE